MTYTTTDFVQAKVGALEDTRAYPSGPNELVEELYKLNAKDFYTEVWAIIENTYNPLDPLGLALAWFHYGYAWRRYQESIEQHD